MKFAATGLTFFVAGASLAQSLLSSAGMIRVANDMPAILPGFAVAVLETAIRKIYSATPFQTIETLDTEFMDLLRHLYPTKNESERPRIKYRIQPPTKARVIDRIAIFFVATGKAVAVNPGAVCIIDIAEAVFNAVISVTGAG